MPKRGIIFDLDQTLIDSQAAELLRREGKWPEVYRMIPDLQPYPGINELLTTLDQAEILVGIVTSSPSSYCNRVIKHRGWKVSATVCYHDTQKKKPHPEPFNLCLKRLDCDPAGTFCVGDDPRDIEGARRAKIISVAAAWGTPNVVALAKSGPDHICQTVGDLRNLLADQYGLK